MIRNFLIISILLIQVNLGFTQFIATPNSNANQIVEELIGTGVSISNIKTKGAIGLFSNGQSAIGINEGIILSTGEISNSNGPNNSSSTSGSINSGSDNNLANYLTEDNINIFDASVIEFDFIPQSDEISISYVFGSDEYPEYVCSEFNDGFAFLISGPGIIGQQNIAQIPNTSTPVSINNINNGDGSCAPNNSSYYKDNTSNSYYIEYDGLTKPLTASIAVIPCQTYHIKLVIADVGDDQFDSGVMLEKGSFKSGDIEINSISFSQHFTYAIEGCNKNAFIFKRDENLDLPLTIRLNIEGTALNGIDYQFIADSIHFEPNIDSVSLVIDPISDSLSDQVEYVVVSLKDGCNINGNIDTIFIRDFFSIADTSYKICSNSSVTLNEGYAFASDQFNWTPTTSLNCSNCQSPIATPSSTTRYYVTATDPISGCSGYDSIDVNVIPYPNVSLTGEQLLCNQASSTINANQNLDSDITYSWYYNEEFIKTTSNPTLNIKQTGDYKVIASHQLLCNDTSNILNVEFINVKVDAGLEQTITYGETTYLDGSSTVNANNIWNSSDEQSIYYPTKLNTLVEPTATTKYVLIDSLKGCYDIDHVTVHVRLFIPTAISPNGDGVNDQWHILGLEEITDYQIRVRNRYGNIVFESIASYEPWDGSKNNTPLPVGTYYYIIETIDKQKYNGSLTIIR